MYKIPFKIFVEKAPFLEYILRQIMYFVKPDIKEDELDNNPLRYAPTDVFLSVGFIVALITYLVIFRPNYKYLSFVKAINPEPLIMNFLLGGFTFASAFCVVAILVVMHRTKICSDIIKRKGYYLWLHCLRFYAIIVLIVCIIFLHAAGLAVNEAKTLKAHIAEHFAAYWIVLVMGFILFFRLFINPIRRYLPFFKSKLLSAFMIIIFFLFSMAANFTWSSIDFGSLINEMQTSFSGL